MGNLEVSHRLHVTSGGLDRSVALPQLPGATSYEPPLPEQLGQQLQRSWPLVAAAGVGGGVIGTKLLRSGGGGIFRGIVGGIAGALAGAAIGIAGLAPLRGDGSRPAAGPAAAPRTTVAEREGVKVMTWNVHGGMGGPDERGSSERELDRLADVIRREQPDVLLLQEVDKFAPRSNMKDTLAELDRRLDPVSAVAGSSDTSMLGREQHVAIMTFNGFSITDARNVVHQDPRGAGPAVRAGHLLNDIAGIVDGRLGTSWKREEHAWVRRNTLEAMVRTPAGTGVRVLGGHYHWNNPRFDTQQAQVGAVAGAIDGWRGPTIWGGDFNTHDGTRRGAVERRMMVDAGLRDTLAGAAQHEKVSSVGHPAGPDDHPALHGGIDRIYTSEHARVLDARVDRSAGTASDHLPVVAELELLP